MSRLSDEEIIETLRLYRETLSETQRLYVDSGKLVRGTYAWLGGGDAPDAAAISDQMNDFHQGLVMKVFASVFPNADARNMEQRQLGRALLEHVWGKSVLGSQLHDAVNWLISAAADFEWFDLIRPFVELPELRDRWGELETLVMRMAKLLTSIDGEVGEADNQAIETMKQQFDVALGRAPESLVSESDTANARDAIKWLRDEAKRLRDGVAPTAAEKPTPIAGPGGSANRPPIEARAEPTTDLRTPEERLSDARAKLDRLVGLENIKDQIETLTNFPCDGTQTRGNGTSDLTTKPTHGVRGQSRNGQNNRCSNRRRNLRCPWHS